MTTTVKSTPVTGQSDGAPVSGEPPALRRIWSRWSLVLAVLVALTAGLWASFPGLFTGRDPLAVDPTQRLLSPSADHIFGTDLLGRDSYARTVYGARNSLTGAGLAVLVAVVVGSVAGSLAAWFGGLADTLVMRFIDVVLSIPGFLLAIALVVLFTAETGGAGLVPSAIAVGLTSSATFARLIRAEVLKVRSSAYVEAAVTSGATTPAILFRHVVPNSLAPTLSLVTVQCGVAVIWIASLSFLGLGTQPPDPEWGLLVSEGRKYIAGYGWLTVFPALTIVAVVLSANHISRYLTSRSTR